MGRTRQCWKAGDLRKGKHYPGYLRSRGMTVDAPWWTVRVEGRRLPLMVDARGKACDAHLARPVGLFVGYVRRTSWIVLFYGPNARV